MRGAYIGLAVLISAASPLQAQQAALDARAAQAIVAGCAAHAAAKQQSHAIAVVDIGGNLVAGLRMDGVVVRTPAGWRLRESRTTLVWLDEK